MTLGAMQPYLFPYLGYFQLMDCVDTYMFCGNLQYMKSGWINRNNICIHKDQRYLFSFSVVGDDHKKNINQRYYKDLKADCNVLKRHIYQTYKRAANFDEAYMVLEEALDFNIDNVAYFNMNADYIIARYLGIETEIQCTDTIDDEIFWYNFNQLEREKRVVYLCNYKKADTYVNAIGGIPLYHKEFFFKSGVELKFLRMNNIVYSQFGKEFASNLSIIDVMMHNKIDDLKLMLKKYQLE